jgi:hypothetical protein
MALSQPDRKIGAVRRLWAFVRDYCSEFGVAWSIARNNDCERIGGHFWGEQIEDDMLGLAHVCSGCGCTRTVPVERDLRERINVKYHCENDSWWSEVTNAGWRVHAVDQSLSELRDRTRDLIGFATGERLCARSIQYMAVTHSSPPGVVTPSGVEAFVLYDPRETR